MDENPYRPPESRESLTATQLVKRGIGAGTILLLTPSAVLIAFRASSFATITLLDQPPFDTADAAIVEIVGPALAIIPPPLLSWQ